MKKIIILGIVFLFVGMVFQPAFANNNNIIDIQNKYQFKDNIDVSNELLPRGKIAYSWGEHKNSPYYFQLDDPGKLTQLADYSTRPWFYPGGTWTNDERWLVCEFGSGSLWEINPVTGSMISFGGGGNIINGLASNPVDNKLYGAGSFNLYEIDNVTGEHIFIGEFGEGPEYMIGIAFDRDGILYGWDVGNDSLWTIDIETGKASLVGPLGMDLMWPQDGHFEMAEDILYLAASTINPYFCGLYKCDEDTGDCTLVGQFENNDPQSGLAIPYIWPNHPPSKPSIDGPICGPPGKLLLYIFNTIDPDGDDVRFHIDWGDGTSEYTSFVHSGLDIAVSHLWSVRGTYIITVYAEDEYGWIGPTSTNTIPIDRNKVTDNMLLLRILDRFPLLQRLLDVWRLNNL